MDKIYFNLDTAKCTACCACVLACMDQNDIDVERHQHPLRNAFEYEYSQDEYRSGPNQPPGEAHLPGEMLLPRDEHLPGDEQLVQKSTPVSYLSVSCQHCDNARCITACPVGCLFKDSESGLTLYDNSKCIGCHSCAMTCPFGAPSFNSGGKMVKCDGCVERLRYGLPPACVRVCPTGALSCNREADYHHNQYAQSFRTLAQYIINETK